MKNKINNICKDFPAIQNSWEKLSHLKCQELIEKFENNEQSSEDDEEIVIVDLKLKHFQTKIYPQPGEIDLIVAGSPCQSFR